MCTPPHRPLSLTYITAVRGADSWHERSDGRVRTVPEEHSVSGSNASPGRTAVWARVCRTPLEPALRSCATGWKWENIQTCKKQIEMNCGHYCYLIIPAFCSQLCELFWALRDRGEFQSLEWRETQKHRWHFHSSTQPANGGIKQESAWQELETKTVRQPQTILQREEVDDPISASFDYTEALYRLFCFFFIIECDHK